MFSSGGQDKDGATSPKTGLLDEASWGQWNLRYLSPGTGRFREPSEPVGRRPRASFSFPLMATAEAWPPAAGNHTLRLVRSRVIKAEGRRRSTPSPSSEAGETGPRAWGFALPELCTTEKNKKGWGGPKVKREGKH